jgi:predicted ATPase
VGKTRLALAVAEHLARELPEPVLMVDLAQPPPNSYCRRSSPNSAYEKGDVLERLVQVLQTRRVLILLDNFEQVMPAAQDLLGSGRGA